MADEFYSDDAESIASPSISRDLNNIRKPDRGSCWATLAGLLKTWFWYTSVDWSLFQASELLLTVLSRSLPWKWQLWMRMTSAATCCCCCPSRYTPGRINMRARYISWCRQQSVMRINVLVPFWNISRATGKRRDGRLKMALNVTLVPTLMKTMA